MTQFALLLVIGGRLSFAASMDPRPAQNPRTLIMSESSAAHGKFNWSTDGILSFNASALETVLRGITETLHQHDEQILQPPWLAKVLERFDQLDRVEQRLATLPEPEHLHALLGAAEHLSLIHI